MTIILDPARKSPRVEEFACKLDNFIVGQSRATKAISNMYQTHLAGMNNPTRPIGTILFLGPTGSGKTRTVEAASEVLFSDPYAVVKIDCAEFQHSHDIAKLIGSPPGYLGHRETSPILTQHNLDKAHTDDTKLTFVLFDEIEKASDSLWQLLLGILDKATLTLGDNCKVDFSKTIVIMTSNLGVKEISDYLGGGIGFTPSKPNETTDDIDTKIYRTALEAAKRRFSPEFMNRIDKVVVFRSLKDWHIRQILELELLAVQNRITESAGVKFVFECDDDFKKFLLEEGTDRVYGARHLKRAIERWLVYPLSNLVATEQVQSGDSVYIDYDFVTSTPAFYRQPEKMIVSADSNEQTLFERLKDDEDEEGNAAPVPKKAQAATSGMAPGAQIAAVLKEAIKAGRIPAHVFTD